MPSKQTGWSYKRPMWAALAFLLLAACDKTEPPPEEIRTVPVVKVRPGGYAVIASYSGDVRARYETPIGFRVAGKIITRNVEIGSLVRQGDVIARLDPADAKLATETVKSQLAAAQADHAQAKADLERYRELFQKKFVSAAEIERRQSLFDVAKARLEQAQAQLGVSENQSEYTTLRAHHAGVITALLAEVGQVLIAGQPVAKLARTDEKEVVISVPENRLEEVRIAKQVSISLWAQPDKVFTGSVREISPSADAGTRTYTVKVLLTAVDAAIQLGMTANVLLKQNLPNEVIQLPLTALFQQGTNPAVWVVNPQTGQAALRPVKIGIYREDGLTVESGLQADELVVTKGVHKLVAGQKVRAQLEVSSQ
jgi:RND family efflux transporter MFP subunit